LFLLTVSLDNPYPSKSFGSSLLLAFDFAWGSEIGAFETGLVISAFFSYFLGWSMTYVWDFELTEAYFGLA